VTKRDWEILSRLLDRACLAHSQEYESYRMLREAQAVVQKRRQRIFLVNHRLKLEKRPYNRREVA
jgi:hypothetical protein